MSSGLHSTVARSSATARRDDILIAATAIADGHSLVTNNERHFERIEGLNIENWLR